MTYLVEVLKKYYRKDGNKLIFKNGLTLNRLALEMWEKMGYQGIDSSSLSRILAGERLFTAPQLEAFCESLGLAQQDIYDLREGLYYSRLHKFGHLLENFRPSYDALDFIDSLIKIAHIFLKKGKYHEANDIVVPLENYLGDKISAMYSPVLQTKALEQLSTIVYIKGKGEIATSSSSIVLKRISLIVRKLRGILLATKNSLHEIRINNLLTHGYYIAGGYINSSEKDGLYKKAVSAGYKAFKELPYSDIDKLLTMRVIAVSTIYLRDRQNFSKIKEEMSRVMNRFPAESYFYGTYLYNAIVRGMLIFKFPESLKIEGLAKKHFHKSIVGSHLNELSDIRHELETYLAIKMENKYNIAIKIDRGLQIAGEENYPRHQKSIEKLAQKLL